ncbi:MAG: hypothetical protein HXY21_08120, partial [Parvularculaceae bacterium]|nr:hypothetical protein [Parvularculaceae bacterium]
FGCASSSAEKAAPSGAAPSGAGGDLVVGALAESTIPKGECGMVLWTLEADQPTPIFRYPADEAAEIVIGGKLVKFAMTEATGASGYGVAEEQRFVAGGLTATVKVRFGLGFDGGAYLERGLLTIEAENGWRSVIPAAGIAGCRQK